MKAKVSLNPSEMVARPGFTAAEWLQSPALDPMITWVSSRCRLQSCELPDLLQEVRIALLLGGVDRRINAAWIFATARHKAMDILRKAESQRLSESNWSDSSRSSQDSELIHLLRARVASLPPEAREFYRLRYEEGFSEREIAERLGVCRASIRWMESAFCRKL